MFKKFGDEPKKSYAKQLEEFAREIEKAKVNIQAKLFGISRQALYKRNKALRKKIHTNNKFATWLKLSGNLCSNRNPEAS